MAWSAGAFTRIGGTTHWVDDKNAAINIVASRHDTNDEDIATGINACLTRDGTSKPAADFLPAINNTYSLGSVAAKWLNIVSNMFQTTGTTILGFGQVAATFLDMTPDSTSPVATCTGLTTAPTTTVRLRRMGPLVMVEVDAVNGTSNSGAFSLTGAIPASFQSARNVNTPCSIIDNGVTQIGTAQITTGSSTLSFFLGSGLPMTSSGSKGIPVNVCFSYPLN